MWPSQTLNISTERKKVRKWWRMMTKTTVMKKKKKTFSILFTRGLAYCSVWDEKGKGIEEITKASQRIRRGKLFGTFHWVSVASAIDYFFLFVTKRKFLLLLMRTRNSSWFVNFHFDSFILKSFYFDPTIREWMRSWIVMEMGIKCRSL